MVKPNSSKAQQMNWEDWFTTLSHLLFITGASLGQVLEGLKGGISSPAHPAEKLELLSVGREVSIPPWSWTLEGRTNLLLSWRPARGCWASPSFPPFSSWTPPSEKSQNFQENSFFQETTFLLVITAKHQLHKHSEDFQGSITASELFFWGEAGDCSQNWAFTQAVPQHTSVVQSIWISFLLNKGRKQPNLGSSLFNKSPLECLPLVFAEWKQHCWQK